MQTWRDLAIDPAGLQYIAADAVAAVSLAVLPGRSVLSIEAEAGLLAAGIRPLRAPHGVIVAGILRNGRLFDFVPDAADDVAERGQEATDAAPVGDETPGGIKALAHLYAMPGAEDAGTEEL